MSDKEAVPGATPFLHGVKKRIVPFEEENPAIEPLFINFVHGGFMGDDFYLDIGVLTLESIDPDLNKDRVGDFAVLNRLVMGKRTMVALREQIDNILQQAGAANAGTP